MLKRIKTNELIEVLEHFPVLGIVGPRQVGKTTLAKHLISQINREAIYIDLENPSDEAKLTDPMLFFDQHQEKCVILDEIQRKPELFPILRSSIDKNRAPGRFLILGSASPHLIRDSSESLAGRIAYEELSPFNLLEIEEYNSLEHHWMAGGFPDAFLAKKTTIQEKWIRNYIRTYVERDLPLLGLNVDGKVISKLWSMLAHMHGSLLNMSNLSKSLELSSTTIKRYLSFLEDAFLIRQLQPYYANSKKRLVKSPKVYVRDSGTLHHLIGITNFQDLTRNPIIGNSWEGYAIEQICQAGGDKYEYCFYRTHQGSECDLVLLRAGKPYAAVEVKYTSSPKLSKGNKNSFDDLATKINFIITPHTDNYLVSKNTRVCNLATFLKQYV